MCNLPFAPRVLLCAVLLAVTSLQSIPTTADDGRWTLAYSFLCDVWDLAVDSQHNVYALDPGDSYPPIPSTIRVFTPDGHFLRERTGIHHTTRGIAIDENDEIYLVNYDHDNRAGYVSRYDLDFRVLGGWRYAYGDLDMGFGIDVRDGIAYIAAANALFKFTTEGALLDRFEWGWRSVEIISDGSVWVAVTGGESGLVRHYSSNGDILDEWFTRLPGDLSSDANDIALDSNQRVFVADGNAGLLKIFRPNGKLDDAIPLWAHSVALDGDDVLYVSASYPTQLMKYVYTPLPVLPTTWGRIKAAFD
jgi:hypothetical protein